MRHLIPLLAIGCLLAGPVLAQTPKNTKPPLQTGPTGFDAQNNVNAIGGGAGSATAAVRTFDGRYEGVKNSPYLLDEWYRADLFLADNRKYENIQLKLNTHRDEVVIRRSGSGDSVIIDKGTISHFVIKPTEDRVIYFRKLQPKGTSKTEFYQVLAEGTYFLLVKHGKELLKADFKGGYSSGRTYDEYVPFRDYFVTLPTDSTQVIKMKANEKSVLKTLGDDGKWAAYLKQNNLNLKLEADLIRFFDYLNKAQ
jgi:hypothetical protein